MRARSAWPSSGWVPAAASSSLVGLTLGTGIGGVIAIDGRVHLGHDGTAGEVGHQTIDPGRAAVRLRQSRLPRGVRPGRPDRGGLRHRDGRRGGRGCAGGRRPGARRVRRDRPLPRHRDREHGRGLLPGPGRASAAGSRSPSTCSSSRSATSCAAGSRRRRWTRSRSCRPSSGRGRVRSARRSMGPRRRPPATRRAPRRESRRRARRWPSRSDTREHARDGPERPARPRRSGRGWAGHGRRRLDHGRGAGCRVGEWRRPRPVPRAGLRRRPRARRRRPRCDGRSGRPRRDGPPPAAPRRDLVPADRGVRAARRPVPLRRRRPRLDAGRPGRRGGAARIEPRRAMAGARAQGRPRPRAPAGAGGPATRGPGSPSRRPAAGDGRTGIARGAGPHRLAPRPRRGRLDGPFRGHDRRGPRRVRGGRHARRRTCSTR